MNPYIYNPAYAGVDGHPVMFLLYKQQWTEIPESPQLAYVTYHAPLKGGIGIGGTIFRDSKGPLSSTAIKASGSYLLNIDRKHFVRFGMSLGAGSNQLVLPEDAINDPAFQGESSMYFIGDFGMTYHFGHFNAGFSLPNLFSSEIITENSFSPFKVRPTDNMLFKINFRGHLNHAIAIEPHFIYRFSNVVASQYEFTTLLHLKHVVWVGGTYRQYSGLVGLIGAKFNNRFAIGGAFELGNQNYGNLTGPSYEIHLGIHLGSLIDHKRSHIDHNNSFFRTHSEDLLEKKRLKDEQKTQLAIESLQNDNEVDKQEPKPDRSQEWSLTEPFSRTNAFGGVDTGQRLERTNVAKVKEVIMAFTPPRGVGAAWSLASDLSQLSERTRSGGNKEVGVKWIRSNENGVLEQTIKWEPILDEARADATVVKESPTNIPISPVNTQVTQEVKRGNHILELAVGNHVIGGSFKNFDDAENLSDKLFHQGFREAKVGYVSTRKHYYVVVRSYHSIERARQEQSRIKSSTGLKDVWVLKVNK